MSGRVNRVKESLLRTTAQISREIEELRQTGAEAPHYMIGFHNGLAVASHHLHMLPGEPKVIQPRTSVGMKMPTPKNPKEIEDEHEYEYLVDQIVTSVREMREGIAPVFHPDPTKQKAYAALEALDAFIAQKTAGKGQEAEASDASLSDQTGSSPVPATPETAPY